MCIWTRKSAATQPRTSPGKSDGVLGGFPFRRRGLGQGPGRGHRAGPQLRSAAPQEYKLSAKMMVWRWIFSNENTPGKFVKILSILSKICTKFCIQYSSFQHFSKSSLIYKIFFFKTKFCKNSAFFPEIFAKFQRFSKKNIKFLQSLRNFGKFYKFACEKMIFL